MHQWGVTRSVTWYFLDQWRERNAPLYLALSARLLRYLYHKFVELVENTPYSMTAHAVYTICIEITKKVYEIFWAQHSLSPCKKCGTALLLNGKKCGKSAAKKWLKVRSRILNSAIKCGFHDHVNCQIDVSIDKKVAVVPQCVWRKNSRLQACCLSPSRSQFQYFPSHVTPTYNYFPMIVVPILSRSYIAAPKLTRSVPILFNS